MLSKYIAYVISNKIYLSIKIITINYIFKNLGDKIFAFLRLLDTKVFLSNSSYHNIRRYIIFSIITYFENPQQIHCLIILMSYFLQLLLIIMISID